MKKIKQFYNKTLIKAGLLLGSVSSAFADGLKVDDFENADLSKGVQNLEAGVKTGANVGLTITMYGAIFLGVIFLLWGSYMAASKDQREEGKLKNGIKLGVLGLIFIAVGFVVKKLAGI